MRTFRLLQVDHITVTAATAQDDDIIVVCVVLVDGAGVVLAVADVTLLAPAFTCAVVEQAATATNENRIVAVVVAT